MLTYTDSSNPVISIAVENFCVRETRTPAAICIFGSLLHKTAQYMSDDEITNQQASWNLLRHSKHQRGAGIFVDICDFIPPMEYKMYDFLTERNVTRFNELGSRRCVSM